MMATSRDQYAIIIKVAGPDCILDADVSLEQLFPERHHCQLPYQQGIKVVRVLNVDFANRPWSFHRATFGWEAVHHLMPYTGM